MTVSQNFLLPRIWHVNHNVQQKFIFSLDCSHDAYFRMHLFYLGVFFVSYLGVSAVQLKERKPG